MLLCCIALASCSGGKGNGGEERRTPTVGYVVMQPANIPLPTVLGGRVVALETSQVRPQVTGLIRKIDFKPGGHVHAGQPLFQIDPRVYRAAVEQAQANLASAQANASAASAKAARYKPLVKIQAVSKQDYDDAAAAARVAKAAVAQSKASLDTAKLNLQFTTVPAPISGRIGRPLFTEGALVDSSQTSPLAIIQRFDNVYVDMQESAANLVRLRKVLASGTGVPGSTKVHLKLDDGSLYDHTGTVEFSDVTVNQDTGSVTLRARFPNPHGVLLPGMFVNAIFDQAVAKGAYRVPDAALQRDFTGKAYVFVVDKDSKVQRRTVQTDKTKGAFWIVTSGLKPGDKVVTQGLNRLRAGTKVKAVPASTPQHLGPPSHGKGAAGKSAS